MPTDDFQFFRGWLDSSLSSMEMLLKNLDDDIEDTSNVGLVSQDDQKRMAKISQAFSVASTRFSRRSQSPRDSSSMPCMRKNTKSNSITSLSSIAPSQFRQQDAAWTQANSKHRRPSFLDQALFNQPRQLVRAIKEKIRTDGVQPLMRVQSVPGPGHWADTASLITPSQTPCQSTTPSVLPSPSASTAIDAFCLRADLENPPAPKNSNDANARLGRRKSGDLESPRKPLRMSILSNGTAKSRISAKSAQSTHRLDKAAVQIIQESSQAKLSRTRSTVNLEKVKWRGFRCSRGKLNSFSTLAASVAMLYSIIMTPVVVCLGGKPSVIASVFEVLCEVALLSTIVAPFFLGTEDPEKKVQLITSWRGVLDVYGRGWLCFDVISLWPWHVMWLLAGGTSSAKWLLYLSIFRFLKLPRLMATVHLHLRGVRRLHLSLHPNVIRAVRLIAFYFFVVHVAACGYYAVGSSSDGEWTIYARDRSSTLSKWAQAFYWALCAVLGENLDPVSDEEVAYSSSILALGVLLNSCIIGSITSLLGSLDERAAKRKSKLDTINTFMERSGVTRELCQQVQQYYLYLHSSVSRDGGLFDDLSASLRLKIDLCIHKKFIGACNIFSCCTPECTATLVTIISRNSVIYVPTELIFRKGDRGDGLDFVVKGEVLLFNPGEDLEDLDLEELEALAKGDIVGDATLFGILHHGDSFGELALIMENSLRNLTAAALTFVELLRLPQRDFENVLCLYPTFAEKIKELVEQHLSEYAERSMNANAAGMARLSEAQLETEDDENM